MPSMRKCWFIWCFFMLMLNMIKAKDFCIMSKFGCLWFFVPSEKFSPIWRCHHCRWRATNWPMLGTHGDWAVRDLYRATPTVTQGIRLKWSSPRTHDTHTCCRALSSFCDLGLSRQRFDHSTLCMRGERSNRLRYQCDLNPVIQTTSLYCKRVHKSNLQSDYKLWLA